MDILALAYGEYLEQYFKLLWFCIDSEIIFTAWLLFVSGLGESGIDIWNKVAWVNTIGVLSRDLEEVIVLIDEDNMELIPFEIRMNLR